MTLPGPTFQLHAALPPARKGGGKLRIQFVRELDRAGALHIPLGNFGVPDVVQVRRVGIVSLVRLARKVFYRDTISAAIAVSGCVQRLVQVADEMDDESQRSTPLGRRLVLVFQDRELLGNSLNDATASSAQILHLRQQAYDQRHIDEVPRRSRRLDIALVVSPR